VTKCKVCGNRIRTPEPYRDCPKCKVRPTVLREIAAAYPPELLPWFAERGSDTPQKSIP
jgi:ABC-type ATPase with predicted acetyltransferase domain